jgi:hypothetical protein
MSVLYNPLLVPKYNQPSEGQSQNQQLPRELLLLEWLVKIYNCL